MGTRLWKQWPFVTAGAYLASEAATDVDYVSTSMSMKGDGSTTSSAEEGVVKISLCAQ